MPLEKCSDCGTEVSSTARVCPKCGRNFNPTAASTNPAAQIALVIAIVLLIMLGIFFYNLLQKPGVTR